MATTHSADHDLGAQQQHLASIDYDLRITNLARFIYKKIVATFPHHSVSKPLKFMDVGAGNGLFLKFFKHKGFEVSGMELEDELVDNMRHDPHLEDVDIRQGDIIRIQGNEEYDIVVASDVIEHINDDVKALQNLWTLVAPGGMLIITVPAHAHLYGKRDVAWGHFRRYDQKNLKSKVESLKSGDVKFITFWNGIGYFAYFLFERILQKPINEKMRYSKSPLSRLAQSFFDFILKGEEKIGGLPLGLTLIVGIQKKEKAS